MTNHRTTGCRCCNTADAEYSESTATFPVPAGGWTTYDTSPIMDREYCDGFSVTLSATLAYPPMVDQGDCDDCLIDIPSGTATFDDNWTPLSGCYNASDAANTGQYYVEDLGGEVPPCQNNGEVTICTGQPFLQLVADADTFSAISVGFTTATVPDGGGCSPWASALNKVTLEVVTGLGHHVIIRYYFQGLGGGTALTVKPYKFYLSPRTTANEWAALFAAQTDIGLTGSSLAGDAIVRISAAAPETRIDGGAATVMSGRPGKYGAKCRGNATMKEANQDCGGTFPSYTVLATNTHQRLTAGQVWDDTLCPSDFSWGSAVIDDAGTPVSTLIAITWSLS